MGRGASGRLRPPRADSGPAGASRLPGCWCRSGAGVRIGAAAAPAAIKNPGGAPALLTRARLAACWPGAPGSRPGWPVVREGTKRLSSDAGSGRKGKAPPAGGNERSAGWFCWWAMQCPSQSSTAAYAGPPLFYDYKLSLLITSTESANFGAQHRQKLLSVSLLNQSNSFIHYMGNIFTPIKCPSRWDG